MRIVSMWSNHLSNTFLKCKTLLTRTTADMDELDRVRNKYVRRDSEFVSSEYMTRVANLSTQMEEELNRMRTSYPESTDREALHRTGVQVQQLFSDMAKRVPMKRLQEVRGFYESKVKECETDACKRFKEDMESWSKSLTY